MQRQVDRVERSVAHGQIKMPFAGVVQNLEVVADMVSHDDAIAEVSQKVH